MDSSRLKRVLIVAEFIGDGGPKKYLEHLVGLIDGERYQLEVQPLGGLFEPLPISEKRSSATVVTCFRPFLWSWTGFPKLIRYTLEMIMFGLSLLRNRSSYDAVIFSACNPGRFFLSRFLPVKRTVIVLHSYPVGPFHRLAGPIFRLQLGRRTTIVCVSEFVKNAAISGWRFRADDERLLVVRNTRGRASRVSAENTEVVRNLVTMVGSVSSEKNPALWIDTAREFFLRHKETDAVFAWLGDGPMLETAKQMALTYGLADRVQFYGHSEDVSQFLLRSKVYLHLSGMEAISMSAIEALAAGVPAVVTNVGGLPEVVNNGVTGYVINSFNPKTIALAVQLMFTDDSLWEKMSEECVIRYQNEFHESIWSGKTLKALALDPSRL